jgi:hypothetical protein
VTSAADLTRRDFDRFFSRKWLTLWRWAFSPQRQRNYRDPQVIAQILTGYEQLAALPPAPVPRHIFMLWQQGWESAPPLVRACADSWKRLNPDWDVHLLDNRTLADFAPGWQSFHLPSRLGRPALANVARLDLLRSHGGVWADATLFATRPLDDWLPQAMESGLFMFSKPRLYRDFDIWFIAAAEGNAALAAWHELVRRYWNVVRRPHHYYWMEYLFELLEASDPTARAVADAMPKLTAMGPLAVPTHAFDRHAPAAIRDLIERNIVPVHKLSHKWLHRGSLSALPLGALTSLSAL